MPYPREHAARMRSPGTFLPKTFRSKSIGKGLRLIIAKKCRSCPMETQAVRFSVCRFTAGEARAWLRRHEMRPLRFDAATGRCGR